MVQDDALWVQPILGRRTGGSFHDDPNGVATIACVKAFLALEGICTDGSHARIVAGIQNSIAVDVEPRFDSNSFYLVGTLSQKENCDG